MAKQTCVGDDHHPVKSSLATTRNSESPGGGTAISVRVEDVGVHGARGKILGEVSQRMRGNQRLDGANCSWVALSQRVDPRNTSHSEHVY